jgi:hypothetical protein
MKKITLLVSILMQTKIKLGTSQKSIFKII